MKIAINRCYGGFGLSAKAYKRYLELKGKECHFFAQRYTKKSIKKDYEEITLEQAENRDKEQIYFHWMVFTTNVGINEYLSAKKDWNKMTQAEKDARNKFYSENYLYDGDISRTDPDLIRVIEELGEEANGDHADLAIVDIPDGIEWEINEYAGVEAVHEKHRSWC